MSLLFVQLIPLAIFIGIDVICLLDLKKAEQVHIVDKTTWAIAILMLGPLGCMAYWMLGRRP